MNVITDIKTSPDNHPQKYHKLFYCQFLNITFTHLKI